MQPLGYILFAVLGLVTGSFLNVLIYRIPRGEGVVKGRSKCCECSHELAWHELIPLFSYVLLRGRCRHCKAKISPRYPVVELLNAVIYMLLFRRFGFSPELICWLVAGSALLAAAWIDSEHGIIPDRFPAVIAGCGVVYTIVDRGNLAGHIIGIFAVSLPLLIIALASKGRAMGGGDIKLMAAAGLLLGWQLALMALFLGAFAGSIISVILILLKVIRASKPVPFAPYLSLGILLSALSGEQILSWYLGLFKLF